MPLVSGTPPRDVPRDPPPHPPSQGSSRLRQSASVLGTSAYESWRINREEEERVYRVLDSVPRFDPQFTIFEDFVDAVRVARSRCPEGFEETFLDGLLSKLAQPVRFYAEDQGCTNTADLIKVLRKRYAPNRTHQEIRYDLENLSMRPDEPVLEYIHRCTRLLRQARASANDEMGSHWDPAPLDRAARVSFIRGLTPNLASFVIASAPRTLEEAMDDALAAENSEKRRRYNPPTNSYRYQYPLPARTPAPYDYDRTWTEWREPPRPVEYPLERPRLAYYADIRDNPRWDRVREPGYEYEVPRYDDDGFARGGAPRAYSPRSSHSPRDYWDPPNDYRPPERRYSREEPRRRVRNDRTVYYGSREPPVTRRSDPSSGRGRDRPPRQVNSPPRNRTPERDTSERGTLNFHRARSPAAHRTGALYSPLPRTPRERPRSPAPRRHPPPGSESGQRN